MEDQSDYIYDDGIPFSEKDQFWEVLYGKIVKAIQNKYSFIVIFQLEDLGVFTGEDYTVIVKKEDYMKFLKNFLLWSEKLERYEVCSEVKSLIQELEKWQEN
jgi:hypothetical protein